MMRIEMRNRTFLLLLLLWLPSLSIAAEASKTLANVLGGLNHFPSETDKQALDSIAGDNSATAAEKVLAGIVSRVAHHPSTEDKMILTDMLKNPDTSAIDKAIATAIMNLNHHATAADLDAINLLLP